MVHFNQLSITPDGKRMVIDVMVRDTKYLKDVYLDELIIDAQDTYTNGGPSKTPYLVRKFRWEDSADKPRRCCGLLMKNAHVILEDYVYKYTGNEIKPRMMVVLDGELLRPDVDYIATYSDNVEVGVGTITITGAGDFSGVRTKKFDIVDESRLQNNVTPATPNPEEADCGCDEFVVPENFNHEDVKIKHARLIIDWQDMLVPMYNSLFFVYVKTKGNPAPDAPCGSDGMYTLGVTANLYPIKNSFICALRELDRDCNIPKTFIDMYLRYEAFNVNVKTGHYQEAIYIWNKWFARIGKPRPPHTEMKADIYPNHAYTYTGVPWIYGKPRPMVRDYQGHTVTPPNPHVMPYGYYGWAVPWIWHYHKHMLPYYGFKDDVGYKFNERYGEHEFVNRPTAELFGGPFNEPVGFYSYLPPIGGCNCGH